MLKLEFIFEDDFNYKIFNRETEGKRMENLGYKIEVNYWAEVRNGPN